MPRRSSVSNPQRALMPRSKISRNFSSKVQKVLNRNVETKFKPTLAIGIAVTDSTVSPTELNLNDVSQGLLQVSRVGNQVRMTGYRYSVQIIPNPSAISPSIYTPRVRCIVYIPRDPTQLLSSATPLPITANIDTDRFTVLYDRMWTAPFQAQNLERIIRKSFKKFGGGMVTQWASATSTDFTKGRLQMYLVSDTSAASEHPVAYIRGKAYFKDA